MRTITVPLNLINLQDDGFHLLVEIVVFGQMHLVVVDTGASRSVFDKGFIESHQTDILEISEEVSAATTLFSTTTTVQALIPELKIGDLKIKDYEAVALDLQSVSVTYQQFGHPPIIGILGGDILVKYHAKISYRKLLLSLYK